MYVNELRHLPWKLHLVHGYSDNHSPSALTPKYNNQSQLTQELSTFGQPAIHNMQLKIYCAANEYTWCKGFRRKKTQQGALS